MAAGWRRAALEAAETRRDAARRGVVEAEMTRANRGGQHLRNQIVVGRDEERRLLGRADRVLVEGSVGPLHAGIDDGRIGNRADVRKAANIAGPAIRRAGGDGLV